MCVDNKNFSSPSNPRGADAVHKASGPLSQAGRPFDHRGQKIRSFRVRLPVAEQLLFLNLPVVRRELAWRERVGIVKAALVLIGAGYSLNAAGPLVGMSPSSLSAWLRKYNEFGEDGLRENCAATLAARGGADGIKLKLTFIK
jgi:hypothetical protein